MHKKIISEAAKEARRAYQREWAKQNPDKVAEYQARFWEKKAEEKAAAGSAAEPAE